MRRYLLRKVLAAFFTLVFVLTVNFFLFRILPSDPVTNLIRNEKLTDAQQQQLMEDFGLDKPLGQQFIVYITHPWQLGLSFMSGQPVADVIGPRIWPTVLLVGLATTLSMFFGVWLGIASGWRRGSRFDVRTLVGTMTFYSMPDFWLGMMLLLVFAATLGWFPVGGYATYGAGYTGLAHLRDVAQHLFLPLVTLTIGYLGEYSLIMRSSLIDVMNDDFVTVARAKGLRDKAVRRKEAVPNALLPIVTVSILYFGYVVGGAVGVEYVFSYPGIGTLTVDAIQGQDFPVIQGVFLLLSFAVILANLVADVVYVYLDPRVLVPQAEGRSRARVRRRASRAARVHPRPRRLGVPRRGRRPAGRGEEGSPRPLSSPPAAAQRSPRSITRARRRRSMKRFWNEYRQNKLGMAGVFVLAAFILIAICAPLIAPKSATTEVYAAKNDQPIAAAPGHHCPAGEYITDPTTGQRTAVDQCAPAQEQFYPLGTDGAGRSVLALLVWGARISLTVGLVATVMTMIIGAGIGITGGYFGGRMDTVLARLTDWFLVIPWIALAIVLASILGQSLFNIMLVIAITSWAVTARLVRAQTLTVSHRPYVERARALGASDWHIITRHVLPNLFPIIFANTILTVALAILAESVLSFLGLGDPLAVSWGTILEQAQSYGATTGGQWWWILPPGVAITVVVLAFTMCGFAVEAVTNPKLRSR